MEEVVVALGRMEAARLVSRSRRAIRVGVVRLCGTARRHLPMAIVGTLARDRAGKLDGD